MIIVIGNQKGGAGKSTLTMLLANYLSILKKQKVIILDMDYQKSIYSKFEKAREAEHPEHYEVVAVPLESFAGAKTLLEQEQDKEQIILIDLPGKMDDDGLIPVISSANLILTPFAYDEFSVDSTMLFAMVAKKLNEEAPLCFIPNRIKANVKYETKTTVDEMLEKFGSVTPAIAERIDFQRINTYTLPISVYPVVMPVLDSLYNQFLLKDTTA